jgi:hypothetical protein
VVVAGTFGGTIDLGGGPVTAAMSDASIAKYAGGDGTLAWSWISAAPDGESAYAARFDAFDDVIAAIRFRGTMDLGGVLVTSTAGSDDVVVAKLSGASASHVWSRLITSTTFETADELAIGPSGEVAVAGGFYGPIDAGCGAPLANPSGGSSLPDAFLILLDASGSCSWQKALGGTYHDAPGGVAVTTAGDVVWGGGFGNTITYEGTTVTALGGASHIDLFLASYSTGGIHQWSRFFANPGDESLRGLAADSAGGVIAGGSFQGLEDFGGGARCSAANRSVWVGRYDAGGAYVWAQHYGLTGSSGFVELEDVTTGALDRIFVSGAHSETIDLGYATFTSTGDFDAMVIELLP